ncbi:hypothetical protein C173_30834 [Paenibacillus sp. FSL R7-277]|nr:hypothetical protein C173_30834 [Paenibacillus sp. FSL R7-277]
MGGFAFSGAAALEIETGPLSRLRGPAGPAWRSGRAGATLARTGGKEASASRSLRHSRHAPRRDTPLARLPVRRRNSASGLS